MSLMAYFAAYYGNKYWLVTHCCDMQDSIWLGDRQPEIKENKLVNNIPNTNNDECKFNEL